MSTTITEKLTVSEFRTMYYEEQEDAHLYELMEGELIRRGSPALQHQLILGKLFFELQNFVIQKSSGVTIVAPMDVQLDEYNCFQPDLLLIGNSQKDIMLKTHIKGAPELVIEIISPSSVMRDRIQKKRVYERAGVQEYWLVSPEYAEIEIFILENSRYELLSAATATEGNLQSKVLEGLQLDLKKIFE